MQAYFTVDSRRFPKKSLRDKKLLDGIKKFNLDPKKGLDYLVQASVLESPDLDTSAKATAQFLFREGRLSKKQIGKFIGGHQDFNQKVGKNSSCTALNGLILSLLSLSRFSSSSSSAMSLHIWF